MWLVSIGSKLVRWRLKLSEYDYAIVYKKREVTDCFSGIIPEVNNIQIEKETERFL